MEKIKAKMVCTAILKKDFVIEIKSAGVISDYCPGYFVPMEKGFPSEVLKKLLEGGGAHRKKSKLYVIVEPVQFGNTFNTFVWVVRGKEELAQTIFSSIKKYGRKYMWDKYCDNKNGKVYCEQKVGTSVKKLIITEIEITYMYELKGVD